MIKNVFDILHVKSKLSYLRWDELITVPLLVPLFQLLDDFIIIVDEIYRISQMGRSHLKILLGLFMYRY